MAEDAAVIAQIQRKQRITRRALIVFAVLLCIAAGVAFWRLQQVRQAKLVALEAIVQSETLALRLNDQNKFMTIQGPTDEWRAVQRRNFAAFQNAEPRVTVTDEILDMWMQRDEARVTVRVMVGALDDKAIWLYAYNPEKGWRHVGTIDEPWATHVLVGTGYTIEYADEDEALAQDLASLVKGWWSSASAVTGDDDPVHIDFVLDRRAAEFQWADEKHTTLIIPSRNAGGDAATKFSGTAFNQLAGLLADRWAEDLLHGADSDIIEPWVATETRQLMRNMFDPAEPRAEFYVRLSKVFGPDVLPEFFDQLRDDPESSEWAMQLAFAETAPRDLRPDDQLPEYFTHYLRAEISFFETWESELYPTSLGQHTRQMFMVEYRTYVPEAFRLEIEVIDPDSIEVVSIEEMGEVMWARTTYSTRPRGTFYSQSDVQTVLRYIPFRLIDGYWRHTTARQSDWIIDLQESRSEHVTLQYSRFDGQHFPDNLVNDLEALYQQTVADLKITKLPLMLGGIAPGDTLETVVTGGPAPTFYISAKSHYTDPDVNVNTDLSTYYYEQFGQSIVRQLISYAGEMAPGVPPTNLLPEATVYIEMRRLGLNPKALPQAPTDVRFTLPQTLEDIWAADPRAASHEELYADNAAYVCSTVLIDLLIERYGIGALPNMTRMLSGIVPGQPPQATIDDWLKFSLNITSEDVEREWRVRCTEALVQYGYLPDQ